MVGVAFFVWLNHVVVAESRLAENMVARVLAHVGVWSYSLYLTHEPTIVATKQLAVRVGLAVPSIVVLRLAVPLAVGYAFHRIVEQRFMNSSPRISAVATAAAS